MFLATAWCFLRLVRAFELARDVRDVRVPHGVTTAQAQRYALFRDRCASCCRAAGRLASGGNVVKWREIERLALARARQGRALTAQQEPAQSLVSEELSFRSCINAWALPAAVRPL